MGSAWRYGRYLVEFGGPGTTACGFTRPGCISQLRHQMTTLHHETGDCTCGAYRQGRTARGAPERAWCDPCKELLAVKAELDTHAEVTYRGRVFYYTPPVTRDDR